MRYGAISRRHFCEFPLTTVTVGLASGPAAEHGHTSIALVPIRPWKVIRPLHCVLPISVFGDVVSHESPLQRTGGSAFAFFGVCIFIHGLGTTANFQYFFFFVETQFTVQRSAE